MLIDFYVKRVIDLVHIVVSRRYFRKKLASIAVFLLIQAESLRKCGYHKIERFVFTGLLKVKSLQVTFRGINRLGEISACRSKLPLKSPGRVLILSLHLRT